MKEEVARGGGGLAQQMWPFDNSVDVRALEGLAGCCLGGKGLGQ